MNDNDTQTERLRSKILDRLVDEESWLSAEDATNLLGAFEQAIRWEVTPQQDTQTKSMAGLPEPGSQAELDCQALDQLAGLLSEREWNADLMEPVFHLIRQSGREITDLDDPTNDGALDTKRFETRRDSVTNLWGVWDNRAGTWATIYGPFIVQPVIYSGVPMWSSEATVDRITAEHEAHQDDPRLDDPANDGALDGRMEGES